MKNLLCLLRLHFAFCFMSCFHFCCLDKNDNQLNFPQINMFMMMNDITSHCTWSQIPMALSLYALAVLRITERKCPPIHYMALERSKILGLKISLLLFNVKRKRVLGHSLSPGAVVLLLHGVRERWNPSHGRSNPEPASIRQHPCPVFNPLPLPHPH